MAHLEIILTLLHRLCFPQRLHRRSMKRVYQCVDHAADASLAVALQRLTHSHACELLTCPIFRLPM